MINPKCFELAWLNKQKKTFRGTATEILERSIFALALLGHLAESSLLFVFKGGTSLLLHLDPIRRLSIDIDIFCGVADEELDAVLRKIANQPPFVRYEEQHRGDRGLPNRRHFKFFYASPTSQGKPLHILLDVVVENACPIDVVQKPIRTSFIEVEREVLVTVPTIEALLGDKLTAFAPRTTGVPFEPGEGRACDTMQVAKQLFDVAELSIAVQDIDAVSRAYDAMLALENDYRKSAFTRDQALIDTRDACVALACHGLRKVKDHPDAILLSDGMRRLGSHLINTRMGPEEARTAAGKVALTTTLLLKNATHTDLPSMRFDNSPEGIEALRHLQIGEPWLPLNRKATNPEAFFYWHKAYEIDQQG